MNDYPVGFTAVPIEFSTHAATGAAVAPLSAFEVGDFKLYRNGSTTPRSSTNGWTIASPLDGVVGSHRLLIDLSDNSDAGFYAAGRVYRVLLNPDTETVDGVAPLRWLDRFSIDLLGIDAEVGAIEAKTDSLVFTGANKVDASVRDWLGAAPNALQAGRVDSYVGAVVDAVLTAAKFAVGAFDAVWAVATRTLTAATNITSTGGTTVPQTGDAYARLGAPAGASVSVDVAAVKADTGAIKAKTDGLPADPADASDIAAAFATVNASLATLAAYVDTEVAAIKAKTDALPADPADASDIAGAFGTVNTTLATVTASLATLTAYVDTEVAAIKAKTDALPTDPADASDLAASFAAITATLSTLTAYVDTEVAAIKAKTDALPGDPADASDIAALFATVNATLATLASYIDTEVAAIKAKTDALPPDPADQSALKAAITAAAGPSAVAIANEVQTRTIAAVTAVVNKVTPVDVDGLTHVKLLTALLAAASGTTLVSGNQVQFKDRAGVVVLTIIGGPNPGERTSSVIT